MNTTTSSLVISGATILDAVSERPLEGRSIWVEKGRIKAIDAPDAIGIPANAPVLDARGRFVIPGLMNANVHLWGPTNLEGIARYMDRYQDVIAEAAQVALRSGQTTVFDTWGPRRFLMDVRDKINAGSLIGSRVFCAGNIIGLDGPFSADFSPQGLATATAYFSKRVNAIFAENVGRHLMWLTPRQVAEHVRAYLAKGVDFLKYASNDHYPGAFLAFSPRQQAAIVEEAHRAGLTAQCHSMTVEGLWIALEAGCDFITHCNITGPTPIPEETLELFVRSKAGAVIFPFTEHRLKTMRENISDMEWTMWKASDINARNLIRAGVPLMLANDGTIKPQGWATDPRWGKTWISTDGEDNLNPLGTGHFAWFKAMEEKGCRPMEMLRAATRNIAVAYGNAEDLGTLEPGKIADMLILDRNPLESAAHYRGIHRIIKDGVVIDHEALPLKPVLTGPPEGPVPEEASYIPFISADRMPGCMCC